MTPGNRVSDPPGPAGLGLLDHVLVLQEINDLAAQFGIDRSAILKYLKAFDIPRRRPALDPRQCEEVCRLYAGGLNSSEIGRIFDVSADTVLRAMRRAGVSIRNRA
jgi:DNA-directed RNA polymerase specialized sigma24 family protein